VKPSDETLMVGVGRGDEQAFEALYGRYRCRLYTFILRYVQDEALAEDLFQEAFLRLLQAAPRWRPQARLSTWLYRVALNLCIDESRKTREVGLSDEAAGAIAGREPGPQEALETAEAAAWLRARVAELPAGQRAVLLLRVYAGLEEREVAEIVGCPVGTVKSRLYHALRKLRLDIGGEGSY
jgi:RNA polymerase sigma-70 factor (ECF subfamily)